MNERPAIGTVVQQLGAGGGYTGEVIEHDPQPTVFTIRWHKWADESFLDYCHVSDIGTKIRVITKPVPGEWWPKK